jgi:hypothetical protein
MTASEVERVAEAVLYEGYLLYPYRPSSVKNRQRWTFGGVHPRAWSEAQGDVEPWQMQSECLLRSSAAEVRVRARFLHLIDRSVGELPSPLSEWPATTPPFVEVAELRVGHRTYLPWQEAVEREVSATVTVADLLSGPRQVPFAFAAGRELEPVRQEGGPYVGVLVRSRRGIEGVLGLSAVRVADDLVRLTVRVANHTPLAVPAQASRDEALRHSLVSSHAILHVRDGAFVSLMGPPDDCRAAAAECRNVGAWPVLVGAEGQADTLLCSPIILYDYPRVAPQSPGDLFDATEIDEILTLRILTLTEEEKREMCAADDRARLLLERTEALAREQMLELHGTMRRVRPAEEGQA